MSSTGRSDVFSLFPETLHLAPGVTQAVLPIQGQMGFILKYISGGSLTVLRNPDPTGQTTVGASFAASNLYLLGTGEILNISHCGSLYLMAVGATCVANLNRLRSQGT